MILEKGLINKAELRKENPDLTEKELHALYLRKRRTADKEQYNKYKRKYYLRKRTEKKVVKQQAEKTAIIEDK